MWVVSGTVAYVQICEALVGGSRIFDCEKLFNPFHILMNGIEGIFHPINAMLLGHRLEGLAFTQELGLLPLAGFHPLEHVGFVQIPSRALHQPAQLSQVLALQLRWT